MKIPKLNLINIKIEELNLISFSFGTVVLAAILFAFFSKNGMAKDFIDNLLRKEVPTGAYQYNGHSYVIYEAQDEKLAEKLGKDFKKLEFQDVEDFCEEKGGHLAVINDAAENEAIYRFVRNEGLTMAFFGYTDEKEEGKWEWIKGESEYENWSLRGEQPNNGVNNKGGTEEDIVEFYGVTKDGTWNDAPLLTNTYHFICEWDYT